MAFGVGGDEKRLLIQPAAFDIPLIIWMLD
jgi:hypothetical protein